LTYKVGYGMYNGYVMNMETQKTPPQEAALRGLAVVGFIALVGLGIWLAVYSTRFVPSVVGSISGAAVYLGSTAEVYLDAVFTSSSEPTLSVVPTSVASTTISTSVTETPEPVTPKPVATTPTTPGTQTSATYPLGSTQSPVTLSGLPDLTVTMNTIGYLTTNSANAFVASTTVPFGSRPAVSFTIKNIGTNATGAWRFNASIPTQSSYIYYSDPQQSLNPGDSIEYTLGFDQATSGTDRMISVSANFDHAIGESNFNNNNASAKITILGN